MRKTKLFLAVGVLALAAMVASCGAAGSSSSSEENSTSAVSSGSSASVSSNSATSSAASSASSSSNHLGNPPTYDSESFQIHYRRMDDAYTDWHLWLWPLNGAGAQYDFNGYDSTNGAVASYPLNQWSLTGADTMGFLVKDKASGVWADKDTADDRLFKFSDFPADANDVHNLYLKSGDANMYYSSDYKILDIVKVAQFVTATRISVQLSTTFSSYILYKNGVQIGTGASTFKGQTSFVYDLTGGETADFGSTYSVSVTFLVDGKTLTKNVAMNVLYKTDAFNNSYYYDGADLGATYSADATSFKVWSPFSASIQLRIYNSGTPIAINASVGDDAFTGYAMTLGDKGVYAATVEGDLAGKYYTYFVTNGTYPNGQEIVDPYAQSAGIDGVRGMIVDFAQTNPDGWDETSPLQIDKKALTPYETHIADITSSDTWSSATANASLAKTFLGACLPGTTYTSGDVTVKTGFDHIKELGVNAVELLPIYDQANDEVNPTFDWGYNPLNYDVIEGSYSSNAYDGYARIREFKTLVEAYHEAGVNVIMDVVYNHVSGVTNSPFDVTMPGYFFRYNSDGSLSNGSGCGNETASDMPMFRKYMIDSTAFWASEYKLGGFRFDLMGLHDLTTMNALTANLKTIDPTICVFGESWTSGTSTLTTSLSCQQVNEDEYVGYGAFNDQMRDALIKGGLNAVTAKGWVTNTSAVVATDYTTLISGLKGFTESTTLVGTEDPDKTINYASCHDNYTLYDRCGKAGITDATQLHYMPMLANSLVLTSQGTPFLLAGEEFLRTKNGDGNSYNSGYAVNALDYSLKITNADIFANYQKLILLKESADGLHLDATGAATFRVTMTDDQNQLSYTIADTAASKQYLIVHNNGVGDLPTVDMSGYDLYLDTRNRTDLTLGSATTFLPFETVIGVKNVA